MKNPKILAIIPARGGSKTIKNKNIISLCGKPLIAYTIVEALKSKKLSNVIVSSDNEEIISVSTKYGAEVPFRRPKKLSSDNSLSIDVIKHSVNKMEKIHNITYDIVVMLQPTTPMRTSKHIDDALKKLINSKADSVISVVNVGAHHPFRMKKIVNNKLKDYADEGTENLPRQKLPNIYIRNGAIYAARRNVVMEKNSFKGKNCIPFVMPSTNSVNIDTQSDLLQAENLMSDVNYDHVKPINSFSVPWKSFYGNESFNFDLPVEWNVDLCNMNDAKEINNGRIQKSLSNPVKSKRISQLAKKNSKVCIVVDDLTKPTEAWRIIPFLLKELKKSIKNDDQIFFLISTGTHRSLTHDDLVKKLGSSIVSKYRVYSHSAYQNNKFIGKTSMGTPLYVDKLFLESDLKIGIGTLMPHPYAGFSGGGKIVMPGLAGIESIDKNHKPVNSALQGTIGDVKGNSRRSDIEEAATMAGLNFIINTVSNSFGKTVAVFSGHPKHAFKAAAKKALSVYATDFSYGYDVGIFNAFPRDTWFLLSLNSLNIWSSRNPDREIVRKGGTIVIINASSEGMGEHGLVGKGMKHHVKRHKHGTFKGPIEGRNIIFFAPNINQNSIYDHYSEDVKVFTKWNDVINELHSKHKTKTNVGIFPSSSLQLDNNLIS